MKLDARALPQRPTARRHVVAVLTQEILNSPESKDFAIASEHQLCRRFSVSRVTVRLALGDLEHKGLIYRRHGKGTFAYGSSRRTHRSIAVLVDSPEALNQCGVVDMIRGVLAAVTVLHSSIVLINIPPTEWQSEIAGDLAGVIVVLGHLTDEELSILEKRHLPFLCIQDSQLTAKDCDCFEIGQRAVHALSRASLTGEHTKEIKSETLADGSVDIPRV